MIRLEGIGRRFGSKWAVRNLDLDIGAGEIFGLVGPNGAGKTTTIRMITGLLAPTEGRVVIGGKDMASDPLGAKGDLGYIPDRAYFYEKLTGREFLNFTAAIRGLGKRESAGRIEALSERLDVEEFADELIEGYSQGMKQRLLFVAALLHDPRALLIDEPIVGLDPLGVIEIKDIIRSEAAGGAAVFLATHSLQIAGELCHRVGMIQEGGLSAMKEKEELSKIEGGLEAFFLSEVGEGRKRSGGKGRSGE